MNERLKRGKVVLGNGKDELHKRDGNRDDMIRSGHDVRLCGS